MASQADPPEHETQSVRVRTRKRPQRVVDYESSSSDSGSDEPNSPPGNRTVPKRQHSGRVPVSLQLSAELPQTHCLLSTHTVRICDAWRLRAAKLVPLTLCVTSSRVGLGTATVLLRPETLNTLNKGKVKKNIHYTGGADGVTYVDCLFASCTVRVAIQMTVVDGPQFRQRRHLLLWRNNDPIAEKDLEDSRAHFKVGSDAGVMYTLQLWAPLSHAPYLRAQCIAPEQDDVTPRWHTLDVDLDGTRVLHQGELPSKLSREQLRRAVYSKRARGYMPPQSPKRMLQLSKDIQGLPIVPPHMMNPLHLNSMDPLLFLKALALMQTSSMLPMNPSVPPELTSLSCLASLSSLTSSAPALSSVFLSGLWLRSETDARMAHVQCPQPQYPLQPETAGIQSAV